MAGVAIRARSPASPRRRKRPTTSWRGTARRRRSRSAGSGARSTGGRRYRRTRSILLRGLGVVYLAAFGSLAVQVDGLIGSRGIAPAAEFLDRAGPILGGPAYWQVPTLLWLDASDRALHVLCWGGVVVAALLVAGILPGACLVFLWLSYLSMVVGRPAVPGLPVGRPAAGVGPAGDPADPLGPLAGSGPGRALGGGDLAVPLAGLPADVPLGRGQADQRRPDLVGLAGDEIPLRDPAAADLDELVHPPAPALVPRVARSASCSGPSWSPRSWSSGRGSPRLVGFASIVLLQVLIAATGNYGFFNLLTRRPLPEPGGGPRLGPEAAGPIHDAPAGPWSAGRVPFAAAGGRDRDGDDDGGRSTARALAVDLPRAPGGAPAVGRARSGA